MAQNSPLQPDDDPEFFEAMAEAKWAKENHRLTKVLGWFLIVGAVMGFISAIMGDRLEMGGILFLIAGFNILEGSQGWLRFTTFICCVTGISAAIVVVWAATAIEVLRLPDLSGVDIDWRRRSFWIENVVTPGYLIGISALCISCLRTRKLRFWTKTARTWGSLYIALMFVVFLSHVWGSYRAWTDRKTLLETFRPEIEAIRRHIDTCRSASPFDCTPTLMKNERIEKVYWTGGTSSISFDPEHYLFSRSGEMSWRSTGFETIPHTTRSGTEGEIRIVLDPPWNP